MGQRTKVMHIFCMAAITVTAVSGVLKKLLRVLHRDGILTEDLSLPTDYHDLEAKYMGLGLRHAHSKRRGIGESAAIPECISDTHTDILTIPIDCWGSALLYFTGNDIVSALCARRVTKPNR